MNSINVYVSDDIEHEECITHLESEIALHWHRLYLYFHGSFCLDIPKYKVTLGYVAISIEESYLTD